MEYDALTREHRLGTLLLKLARDGDAVSLKKVLSLQYALLMINYQAVENGETDVLLTVLGGHAAVTELLI